MPTLLKRASLFWIIAAAWLTSALYLAATGHLAWLAFAGAAGAYQLLLAGLTARLTRPMPEEPVEAAKPAPWRTGVQLAFVLLVIARTGLSGTGLRIPVWTAMVDGLEALGEHTLPVAWVGGPGNALANPVQYFVIPLLLLLLLGARLPELGLSRGHRAWQVSALWSALPLITWLALMPNGLLPPNVLARRLIGNSLQNGFFEEFLFRGALQTRLNRIMPPIGALALQAALFGLWHLDGNTRMMGGDMLAGAAACLVSQTISGLAYGLVFSRTRNLLAPSVAHVMMNAFGQTFG
jgi:membrane protease YdiL (CAAX protease family)